MGLQDGTGSGGASLLSAMLVFLSIRYLELQCHPMCSDKSSGSSLHLILYLCFVSGCGSNHLQRTSSLRWMRSPSSGERCTTRPSTTRASCSIADSELLSSRSSNNYTLIRSWPLSEWRTLRRRLGGSPFSNSTRKSKPSFLSTKEWQSSTWLWLSSSCVSQFSCMSRCHIDREV